MMLSTAVNMSANLENSAVATGLVKVSFHSNPKEEVKLLSYVLFFAVPLTVAYQALPSMAFSRQEYWSVLPFPSPGDLPDLQVKLRSPIWRADALPSEPPGKPKEGQCQRMSQLLYNCSHFTC